MDRYGGDLLTCPLGSPGCSGGFVSGFGEGKSLVTEIGDYFQPAAESLDVGGECAQLARPTPRPNPASRSWCAWLAGFAP
jgi:hypothetical protein